MLRTAAWPARSTTALQNPRLLRADPEPRLLLARRVDHNRARILAATPSAPSESSSRARGAASGVTTSRAFTASPAYPAGRQARPFCPQILSPTSRRRGVHPPARTSPDIRHQGPSAFAGFQHGGRTSQRRILALGPPRKGAPVSLLFFPRPARPPPRHRGGEWYYLARGHTASGPDDARRLRALLPPSRAPFKPPARRVRVPCHPGAADPGLSTPKSVHETWTRPAKTHPRGLRVRQIEGVLVWRRPTAAARPVLCG